jgi:hypothetical protein
LFRRSKHGHTLLDGLLNPPPPLLLPGHKNTAVYFFFVESLCFLLCLAGEQKNITWPQTFAKVYTKENMIKEKTTTTLVEKGKGTKHNGEEQTKKKL